MSRAIKRLFRRIELGLERPQKEIDLAALTDDELMERLREFVAKMVNSWRVSGTQEDALRNLSTTMGHSTGLIREQCPVW